MPLNSKPYVRYYMHPNPIDISKLNCLFTAYNILLFQGVSYFYIPSGDGSFPAALDYTKVN